jgi:hypothetical protein
VKVKVGCLCHSAAIALEFHHATIQLPIQALIQVVRPKYMRCEVFIYKYVCFQGACSFCSSACRCFVSAWRKRGKCTTVQSMNSHKDWPICKGYYCIQPAETRTTVRAQSPYMTYMVMDTLGPNKKICVPSFRPLRASSFWRLFCKVAVLREGSAQNSSWEPTCTSIQALLWYQDILRAAKVLSGRLVHFMLFCTEQPNALWLLKT